MKPHCGVMALKPLLLLLPLPALLQSGEKVADMTGAKVDKLKSLIEEQLNQN